MKNQWIVPDIHGHLKTLKFLIEDRIALSKSDSIYFLGDYIDRGPDSKGVIDFIMNLQNSGYDVHCIRGNHEDYCIRAWESDQNCFLFRSKIEKDWRKNGALSTHCYVRMYSPDGFMQGYGMESDQRARSTILYNNFNNYAIIVKDTTEVLIDSVNFIGPFQKK